MRQRTLIPLRALAILLAAAPIVTAQTHPNLEPGFYAEKAYQVGDIDHVNLFNGVLAVTLPFTEYSVNAGFSYRLTLVYSSAVWDFKGRDAGGGVFYTQAIPCQRCNSGAGFSLSLGRLYAPNDPLNTTPSKARWQYVAPDSSEHALYSTLHEDETAGSPLYTRHGTYLRLKEVSSTIRTVELPDGQIHTFTYNATYKWRITRMEDRFGNYVNVTYPTTSRWELTDRHGRVQQVNFRTSAPGLNQVSTVVLKAFNGTTATYTFSYADTVIDRNTKDNDPTTSATVSVPLLTGITLPDGSSYSMPAATSYYTASSDTGMLKKLGLPTGGSINYVYQGYTFSTYCIGDKPGAPDEPGYIVFNSNRGIATRTFKDASGAGLGEWVYTTAKYWDFVGECPRDFERVTKVLSPSGNATVHYFYSHWPGGWPYGLPYSYFQASDTYRLSVEYFDGDTTIACDNETSPYRCTTTGTPKRRAWVEYTSDTPPTSGPDTEKYDTNRRVLADKTVYHDDGDRYATTVNDSSTFDGLGHYRTATSSSGPSPTWGNARTTTTNYNPNAGTYPASFTPPSAGSPWILTTYSYQDQTEGTATARQEFCFDSTTGFLTRVRTLKNGTSRHATDLLAIYTPDASTGNRIREQYHGGDKGSLNLAPICDALLEPGAYEYRIDHQYDYGTLKRSQYYRTGGSPFTFYSVDRDIDLNTGLVKKSRDVAGIETAFTYDALGRMTWAKPTTGNGAWVENAYYPYGADYARVETYQRPNGSTTGVLARKSLRFDHLGRPFLEKQLLPDSSCGTPPCWNQRKTKLYGTGWTEWQSEWYPDGTVDDSMKKTKYESYDPFGRPQLVLLPDYTELNNHKIELVYSGVRETRRKTWVATSADSEAETETTEIYDRHGRLYQVKEYSDAANPMTPVTSTYTYDVGNRLSGASTVGAVTQTRSFTYDNRGFLTSEVVPEVGSSGGGTRTYSKYDSRGHLGRYQDGLHDIAYDYDDAERLTIVAQANGSGDPDLSTKLKELTYATANTTGNFKLGKLETAVAYNPEIPASVIETYTYGGVAGRVSARQTQVEGHTVTQAFTWNDLGLPASVGYPDTDLLNNTSQEPTRSVTYSYANGFLTSIPSYAGTISYHVNTMVNRIDHANAVKVDHTIDPDNMRRPRQIALTNANGSWSYGAYAYDGAGNIKAIGTDTYVYDKVSRLTSGSFSTASCGAKSQTAAYNPFGFMTSTTTTDWATQTFTELSGGLYNRISGVGYDAAGNTTTWGSYGYTWNRLNQMLTATSGANHTFIYTADGERVSDRVGTTKTVTIRDLSNKVLRIYAYNGSAWSWSKDYVYRDGQLLATVEPPFASQVVKHVHLDHLGTPRRVTNSSRNIIATHDYYPFGMEACGTADSERMKFTGHELDGQGTGSQTDDLTYMHARYYNANIGRFLSVDPAGTRPRIPQGWNRLAYARGNPFNRFDPDGLTDISILIQRGAETTKSTPGTYSTTGVAASGHTLEPPGRDNRPFESRVPAGTYKATRHDSPNHGSVLKLHGVLGRTDILMHSGNVPSETKGCILPGTTASTDKVLDSRLALTGLLVGIDFIARIDAAKGESTNILVTIQDPPAEKQCVGPDCPIEQPDVAPKEPTPKDVPQTR